MAASVGSVHSTDYKEYVYRGEILACIIMQAESFLDHYIDINNVCPVIPLMEDTEEEDELTLEELQSILSSQLQAKLEEDQ